MEKWPNFFIVGAPKCATTSLYEYLKNIPGIYMSPIKEPHYFSPRVSSWIYINRISDKKKYLRLLKDASNVRAIGEASTSYLHDPEAVNLIHGTLPYAKIIIILRDPVERSFSHYLFRVQSGGTRLSFSDVIKDDIKLVDKEYRFHNVIESSFYYESVKRYLKKFGSSQVKIIIFEDFVKDSRKTVKNVLKFLEIKSELPENVGKIFNPYLEPRNQLAIALLGNSFIGKISNIIPANTRKQIKKFLVKNQPKPEMKQQDIEFLINYFQDDVRKLQLLLNRKFPWTNFF